MPDHSIDLGNFTILQKRLWLKVNICVAASRLSDGGLQKCRPAEGVVDTGATTTVISNKIVKELNLINTSGEGSATIASNEKVKTKGHFIDITIKGEKQSQSIQGLQVISLVEGDIPVDILIGMDIISGWSMLWDGEAGIVRIIATK